MFQRFQFQGQAFNFLIVVLTGLIVIGAGPLEEGRGDLFNGLVLLLPLITGPFGYLYLAHDLMIFGIAGYIQRDLSQEVSQLLGHDVSLADARFEQLSDAGLLAHRVLAPLRWLLFLFPTVIPVVYVAFFTEVWKVYPFSVLFALDCIVIAVLLLTMAAAAREQAVWRRRHSGSPALPAQGSTPR